MKIQTLWETATPTRCDVLVDDQIVLTFKDFGNGQIRNTATRSEYDSRTHVPRSVFMRARGKAIRAIRAKQKEVVATTKPQLDLF